MKGYWNAGDIHGYLMTTYGIRVPLRTIRWQMRHGRNLSPNVENMTINGYSFYVVKPVHVYDWAPKFMARKGK